MPKVLKRKLSPGEELENRRKLEGLGRKTNTYTFSVKLEGCHYKFYQATLDKIA